MPLSKHEVKVAFLEKCASLGLTGSEIEAAALSAKAQIEKNSHVKQAVGLDVGKTLGTLGTYGVVLPLAASAALGMGAGHVAAQATAPQETPEEFKKQEMADTYRQYADYIRQQALAAKADGATHLRSPSFR